MKVLKERMKYRGGEEDDVLVVYLLVGGVVGCKESFLSQALASRKADDYNGVIICMRKVYN